MNARLLGKARNCWVRMVAGLRSTSCYLLMIQSEKLCRLLSEFGRVCKRR